jgi:hypothetical protein
MHHSLLSRFPRSLALQQRQCSALPHSFSGVAFADSVRVENDFRISTRHLSCSLSEAITQSSAIEERREA